MPRRILGPALTAALALSPAGVLAACGESQAPPSPAPRDPSSSAPAPQSASSASTGASAAPPPSSSRPRPSSREGETSVEALFARARDALRAGDDASLVLCLEPGARRTWLADTLLAIEIEAQVPRYQDELARRRGLSALRERVVRHLTDRKPGERPSSLDPEVVEAALVDRVGAPDALLAELLTVSRGLGHPLDPVGAASEGRVRSDVSPGPAPRASAAPPARSGLARALLRIDRSRDLAEVHLEDDQGIALVRAPDGGLEPVRLVRRGDTLWIDES
jgi:hypothetical protein